MPEIRIDPAGIKLKPASLKYVRTFLDNLPEDRLARIERITGKSAATALVESIEQSDDTYCGVDDAGSVVTIGGVMPTGKPGIGYVWQFIGPDLPKHKRSYIEQSRIAMARGLIHYKHLITCIECDYRAALRHMRRLGWKDFGAMDVNGIACRIVGVSAK